MRGEAPSREHPPIPPINRQLTRHYFPLVWLLVASLAGFGLFVAWDAGLISLVFLLDQSHIALIITGLALIASGHAAWHIMVFSDRIAALVSMLDAGGEDNPDASRHDARFMESLLADLSGHPAKRATATGTEVTSEAQDRKPATVPGLPHGGIPAMIADTDSIIEIHADRLRSPVEFGWFLVDLAVRLGLIGTIVGFILIFTSLSDTTVSGADGIKDLLVAMSSGMGTALLTTLTGLVAASLLSLQYLILGREAETLVGLMVRLRNSRRLPVPFTAAVIKPHTARPTA